MNARVWLLASLPLVVFACKGTQGGRPDARAIVRAYEDFQNAKGTDRKDALDALANTGCDPQATCADRDACVTYGRALLRAQELIAKARELGPTDAGGNGAATPSELVTIVAGADDATKAATDAEPACREALSRLYARTH